MKKKKIIFGAFTLLLFFASWTMSTAALAANPPQMRCPGFIPGCETGFNWGWDDDYQDSYLFEVIVPNIILWIMWVTAAVAILMGVVSGVMYLYAGISEELKTRATKTFVFSGAGLLLSMFAYFIVEMINRFPYGG